MSLVSVSSEEITFPTVLKRETEFMLKVRNKLSWPVCFKVKTNAPKNYLVKPSSGVIPMYGFADIKITLNGPGIDPPVNSDDRFLIKAVRSAEGRELTSNEWSAVHPAAIQDIRMHVVFPGSTSSGGSQVLSSSGLPAVGRADVLPVHQVYKEYREDKMKHNVTSSRVQTNIHALVEGKPDDLIVVDAKVAAAEDQATDEPETDVEVSEEVGSSSRSTSSDNRICVSCRGVSTNHPIVEDAYVIGKYQITRTIDEDGEVRSTVGVVANITGDPRVDTDLLNIILKEQNFVLNRHVRNIQNGCLSDHTVGTLVKETRGDEVKELESSMNQSIKKDVTDLDVMNVVIDPTPALLIEKGKQDELAGSAAVSDGEDSSRNLQEQVDSQIEQAEEAVSGSQEEVKEAKSTDQSFTEDVAPVKADVMKVLFDETHALLIALGEQDELAGAPATSDENVEDSLHLQASQGEIGEAEECVGASPAASQGIAEVVATTAPLIDDGDVQDIVTMQDDSFGRPSHDVETVPTLSQKLAEVAAPVTPGVADQEVEIDDIQDEGYLVITSQEVDTVTTAETIKPEETQLEVTPGVPSNTLTPEVNCSREGMMQELTVLRRMILALEEKLKRDGEQQ